MISWSSLYHVVEAMMPLYAAMALGYASVRKKAFTPEQCAGINHFVALLAVPLLIFRMISSNNPYTMNIRFLAADTLQKVIILAALAAWARFSKNGSIAWVITLFSLATLPNTVLMGVPVLRGMYGPMSENLMVQIVVLQFVVWYVLVVFLFEYMAAQNAFMEQQLMPPPQANGSHSVDILAVNADGSDPDVSIAQEETTRPSGMLILCQLLAWACTFMARRKKFITCGYYLAVLAMVMRFLIGPIVMLVSSFAVGLHGVFLNVGVVQAALPLAVLSFVYAEEYNVHPDIMSTGVIMGIFISVPLTILYYVLLGLRR
ncbi:auxin efflux carrier [Musa troglodytarum]|uniref:Auxin efflux carrier n=1 Tax=Musa troglodytarum TaxID=320322 RepID=A0A9E7H709_9LILI|nr:auxin efflux carrier [Musa troglodytarum]